MSIPNEHPINYNLSELVWGVGLMIVAAYIYFTAVSFPSLPDNPVGPGTFPSLIAMVLFPCGVFITLQNIIGIVRQQKKQTLMPQLSTRYILSFLLVILIPLSNILFSDYIGFVLTSIMSTTLLMFVMRKGKFISCLSISASAVIVFNWVFSNYLLVPLPTGTFFQ